jgi:hypothetical protein
MISQKVIESIKPTLKKIVDDSFLPHIENIQSAHHVLNLQREEIQGGGSDLDASLLGCSGVVGLEFNLACFCTWSRDMLSGLNGSDLLLLFLGV